MALYSDKIIRVHDDYMTDRATWESIRHFIPKRVIWEAFYGDGSSGRHLQEMGFDVIHRDVNFFTSDLGEVIVSNPPFTIKKEVLRRLKELDKPFIIICPISMICRGYFIETFGGSIQLIIPRKRIEFRKIGGSDQTNRCAFDSAFFCYKIGLPEDIIFLG